MSFDLLRQAWVPVVTDDFQLSEISLVALFERWTTLREILADNPPTTLALYRFLFAILHRAYDGPRDPDHWHHIWQDDGARAIAYLKHQSHLFDLFDSKQPFMQDPALTQDLATPVYNFSQLQGCNTPTLFCHSHSWSAYSISFPQAARLIIRLQSVDLPSLRAAYPGFNGSRSASGTPLVNVLNCVVRGSTLKETLLSNLMQYDSRLGIPAPVSGHDLPTWEVGYTGKPSTKLPSGYLGYLTYPWRRVRLFPEPEGDRVFRLALTRGDSLPDHVSFAVWESFVPFKDQKKPCRIASSRLLWRDVHSFLQSAVMPEQTSCRPRIFDWIQQLYSDSTPVITFWVFGFLTDKAKPLDWSFEQFSAPSRYLIDRDLWTALCRAVTVAERASSVFRSFRGSPYYCLAEGLNPPGVGDHALSQQALAFSSSLAGSSLFWLNLTPLFQRLLIDLLQDFQSAKSDDYCDGQAVLSRWLDQVHFSAQQSFVQSVASIHSHKARALSVRALFSRLRKLKTEFVEGVI